MSNEVTYSNVRNRIFADLIGKYLDTGQETFYTAAYSKLYEGTVRMVEDHIDSADYYEALSPAEDIAQSFWMAVFEKKYEAFNMVVSLRNFTIDEIRKAASQKRGGDFYQTDAAPTSDWGHLAADEKTPEHYAEVDNQIQIIKNYVADLPKSKQRIAYLGILDTAGPEDIAKEVGVTKQYASKVLLEIRTDVRELLTSDTL